jgi:electron transfer flavoprotein alpha/beta subunit
MLAQGIRKLGGADLIFCGEESADGATGQVPSGLAEWLEISQLTLLTKIEVDKDRWVGRGRRALKGVYEILEAPLPCVVSVKTACNEPRFMDYWLKPGAFEKDRVTVWNVTDLDATPDCIGLPGSPTIVTELGTAPVRERKREFLQGSPEEIAEGFPFRNKHMLLSGSSCELSAQLAGKTFRVCACE